MAKILRYILGVLGLFFDQINKFSDYSNVSTSQLGVLHLHRILRICLNLVQKRLDRNPNRNWAKCMAIVYYILHTIFILCANLNRSERNIYDAGVTKPFYLTSFEKMSYKLRPLTVGWANEFNSNTYIHIVNCPWQVHPPSLLHNNPINLCRTK